MRFRRHSPNTVSANADRTERTPRPTRSSGHGRNPRCIPPAAHFRVVGASPAVGGSLATPEVSEGIITVQSAAVHSMTPTSAAGCGGLVRFPLKTVAPKLPTGSERLEALAQRPPPANGSEIRPAEERVRELVQCDSELSASRVVWAHWCGSDYEGVRCIGDGSATSDRQSVCAV